MLGCRAQLTALWLTNIEEFLIADAHSLEELHVMSRKEICEHLIISYFAAKSPSMTIIRTSFDEEIAELAEERFVLAIGVSNGIHIGHRFLLTCQAKSTDELRAAVAMHKFWPYRMHCDLKK